MPPHINEPHRQSALEAYATGSVALSNMKSRPRYDARAVQGSPHPPNR
jgi:hypothetical protein